MAAILSFVRLVRVQCFDCTVHAVVGLNYSSQDGAKLNRDSYYDLKNSIIQGHVS